MFTVDVKQQCNNNSSKANDVILDARCPLGGGGGGSYRAISVTYTVMLKMSTTTVFWPMFLTVRRIDFLG